MNMLVEAVFWKKKRSNISI